MSGLAKLGPALLVVFAASLLAFTAELIYVLCHRRRPRREPSRADAEAGPPRGSPTSKHLPLYFLCWKKNPSRVEPASAAVTPVYPSATAGPEGVKASTTPEASAPAVEVELELELAGWRGLHASRVLFTINEEEEEGADSDGGKSLRARGPAAVRHPVVGEGRTDEQVVVVVVAESTPFATPCDSPPFCTPSPSPTPGPEAGAGTENLADVGGSKEGEVFPFPEKKQPRWGQAT